MEPRGGRSGLRALGADLIDLVLPGECPGCRASSGQQPAGMCARCSDELVANRIAEAHPQPMPADFPPTMAAGEYAGVLRELLLAYKERGRHQLAKPLAERLAATVYAGLVALRTPPGTQLALVPVPDTPAAARARYGDHLRRLAEPAARILTQAGFPAALPNLLTVKPRADSATLDSHDRLIAAAGAFRVRPVALPAGAVVVLLDDIVTTGATLAGIGGALREAGIGAHLAAVLAATRRRNSPS